MKDEHIIVTPRLKKIMTEILNKIGRIKCHFVFNVVPWQQGNVFFYYSSISFYNQKLMTFKTINED